MYESMLFHQPPAEALQMARILEDSKQASELNGKVEAVLAIVPGCTEEQIHLALHDNGYDLDKAISALLDSDGQSNEVRWSFLTLLWQWWHIKIARTKV